MVKVTVEFCRRETDRYSVISLFFMCHLYFRERNVLEDCYVSLARQTSSSQSISVN